MRRLLIVCVGMVLVCSGSAFGGEPKWVCAPEITPPGWYQQLVHKEKLAVGFDDFSVVDDTILALAETGVFLQVRRADGSVAEVNNTAFAEPFSTNSERCLFKDYYVELGESRSPWNRTFVVKPEAGGLEVGELSPSSWLLRQRLYDQVWFQQAAEADARGEKRPPEEPVSRRFPRTVLFYFRGQSIESYAVAEGHLVALSAAQGRSFVTCFDLQSGKVFWSRELTESIRDSNLMYGRMPIVGGVCHLHLSPRNRRTGGDKYVALDLESGRVLRRDPVRGPSCRCVWEEGRGHLLLLQEGLFGTENPPRLALIEEATGAEVWSAQPPRWRRFGFDLAESRGEVFVPFERFLHWQDEKRAAEHKEPWLAEAQKDPFEHGVMCYRLSDGSLKATYGLDVEHLPGAPRDDPPESEYWFGTPEFIGNPPIVTEDLVILSPVVLSWKGAWTWAVGVFSRKSGELLDVLWPPIVSKVGMRGWTNTRKMEVHGNELFLLTMDARLCCFELPRPNAEPDAGE